MDKAPHEPTPEELQRLWAAWENALSDYFAAVLEETRGIKRLNTALHWYAKPAPLWKRILWRLGLWQL